MGSPITTPDGQPQITAEMIDKELAATESQIKGQHLISEGLDTVRAALRVADAQLTKLLPKGSIQLAGGLLVTGLLKICEGYQIKSDLQIEITAAHRDQMTELKRQMSSNILVPRTVVRRQ